MKDRLGTLLRLLVLLAVALMPSQFALTWYGPELVEAVSKEVGFDASPRWALFLGGRYFEVLTPQRFDLIAFKLENPLIAFSDLLMALAALVALVHLALHREWKRVLLPPWPLWTLALSWAVSGVAASSPLAWGKELAQGVFYAIVAVMVFGYLLKDELAVRRWVAWWMLVTFLTALWGLYDYARFVFLPPAEGENPLLVRAGFMSRTAYCGYFVLALPLGYGFLLNASSWLVKVLWGIWLTIALVPLLSLGAFLGLALAFAFLAALVGGPRAKTIAAVVGLFLGLGVLVYEASLRHGDYLRQSVGFLDAEGRVAKRYLEWQASLHLFEAHPLFGVGFGEYQRTIGQGYYFLPNPEKMEPDTYNLYLLLLAQGGIMAPLTWLVALFYGLHLTRRVGEQPASPYWGGLAKGIWAAMAALLFFSLWGTILLRGTGLAWAFLWALLARLQREHAPPKPPIAPKKAPAEAPETVVLPPSPPPEPETQILPQASERIAPPPEEAETEVKRENDERPLEF